MKKLVFGLLIFLSPICYSLENDIPERAFLLKDQLYKEITTNFNYLPNYNYIPALIEHESCITLKSPRCWSEKSKLLSKREEGAGFFQLTRAYKEDGSIRFDTVFDLKNKYKEELKDLSWSNIYFRPDLQLRAGVLLVKDLYDKLYNIKNEELRLHFTDAAYNGGLNGVYKERRACSMSSNCNPDVWFNNVEKFCLKSKKPLYGNKSACDINRYHVKDVFKNKLPKYAKFYFSEK